MVDDVYFKNSSGRTMETSVPTYAHDVVLNNIRRIWHCYILRVTLSGKLNPQNVSALLPITTLQHAEISLTSNSQGYLGAWSITIGGGLPNYSESWSIRFICGVMRQEPKCGNHAPQFSPTFRRRCLYLCRHFAFVFRVTRAVLLRGCVPRVLAAQGH